MPNPPIGLGYLASILRENGHEAYIIDCAILKQSYSQIISQIKQINPDVIGITALSSYYSEMRNLSFAVRKLGLPIILGGVHATALPELSLKEYRAEFVVVGEGELTILELINNWNDIESRKKVRGVAYVENGKVKINPRRELIQNLDEIPFPAWDLINPLKYPREPHGHWIKRFPIAPILTTRGCPYSCSYCASTNFWGNKFRRRSPKNVVDEIEYLVDKFGIREIHIWDDNFTLIKKHVVGVCREILQRNLDLSLSCPNGVRIDRLNREVLKIMKRAGFYSLTFAIESGAQSVLDKANKNINLRIIPKITKLAKRMGFFIPSFFVFGLPGETYGTARKTIQFAKSLPLDSAVFFMAKPLPGSKLFEELLEKKDPEKINYDWFHFYVTRNQLILSDGKRKLMLPKDAYREFFFRPKQIFRFIKLAFTLYKGRTLLDVIKRVVRLLCRF